MLSRLSLLFCLSYSAVYAQAPRAIVIDRAPAVIDPEYSKVTVKGVTIHYVQFDARTHQLILEDQINGPNSQWKDAATLGKSKNVLTVINGGFFTPRGKPLGTLLTQGKRRGSNNPSSLGSGFLYFSLTESNILRRSQLHSTIRKNNPHTLLQSGPILTYQSKTTAGLSDKQSRVRSFIARDDQYYWLIGYAESATLAALGNALTEANIGNVSVYTAINLDGGRSSDLWISPSVKNGNKTFRAFWNKPVRNFLLLTKK